MTEESISKKIAELFDLYKSGAISKEEYEKLKKQILSEHGIDNIENGNEQEKISTTSVEKPIRVQNSIENGNEKEKGNTTSVDKPIRVKKGLGISNLAIFCIVFIIIACCFLYIRVRQPLKDIDGNVYKTVIINKQVWMAENLKTTKYRDGTAIPLVTDDNSWAALSTPAWYNNNIENKGTYGALYNWYTVNTGQLCPFGWHVPSDAEWGTLIDYFGGGNVAGLKMKETGTTHWIKFFTSPNPNETNKYGFTALPSGFRGTDRSGLFANLGKCGFWWSSTESGDYSARDRFMVNSFEGVSSGGTAKLCGESVRCIRN